MNSDDEEKYRSFELFRANVHSPEIITFDELFERCRYIVEAGDDKPLTRSRSSVPDGTRAARNNGRGEGEKDESEDDDIPF